MKVNKTSEKRKMTRKRNVLIEKEESRKVDFKYGEKCSIGEEGRTVEEFKKEEKCLIGEEDAHDKEEGDILAVYHPEKAQDFIKENKVKEMKEKEKLMEKELGEQIVFKAEREAVSRVKEKLQEQATMEAKGERMLQYEIYIYL